MGTLADDYMAARREADRPKRPRRVEDLPRKSDRSRQVRDDIYAMSNDGRPGPVLGRDYAIGAAAMVPAGVDTLSRMAVPNRSLTDNAQSRSLFEAARNRAPASDVPTLPELQATARRPSLATRARAMGADAMAGGQEALQGLGSAAMSVGMGAARSTVDPTYLPRLAAPAASAVGQAVVSPFVDAPRQMGEGGRTLRTQGYELARPTLARAAGNTALAALTAADAPMLARGVAGLARGARSAPVAARAAEGAAVREAAPVANYADDAPTDGQPLFRVDPTPRPESGGGSGIAGLGLVAAGGALAAPDDARAQGRGVGQPGNNVDERPMSREELMANGGARPTYPPPSYATSDWRGSPNQPPRPDPYQVPMQQAAPGGPFYPGGGEQGQRVDSGPPGLMPVGVALLASLVGRGAGGALAREGVDIAERQLARADIRSMIPAAIAREKAVQAQRAARDVGAGIAGAAGGVAGAYMDPNIPENERLAYALAGVPAALGSKFVSDYAGPRGMDFIDNLGSAARAEKAVMARDARMLLYHALRSVAPERLGQKVDRLRPPMERPPLLSPSEQRRMEVERKATPNRYSMLRSDPLLEGEQVSYGLPLQPTPPSRYAPRLPTPPAPRASTPKEVRDLVRSGARNAPSVTFPWEPVRTPDWKTREPNWIQRLRTPAPPPALPPPKKARTGLSPTSLRARIGPAEKIQAFPDTAKAAGFNLEKGKSGAETARNIKSLATSDPKFRAWLNRVAPALAIAAGVSAQNDGNDGGGPQRQ